MGRVFVRYIDSETVHCCAECGTHLAAHDTIISKAFQGRHGRAYLFSDVLNTNSGPTENRLLLTGLHVVTDIYCNYCDTRLGWKYLEAFEEAQKYKEGKFILEKSMILKEIEILRRKSEAEAAEALEADEEERREVEAEAAAHRSSMQRPPALPVAVDSGQDDDDDDEDDDSTVATMRHAALRRVGGGGSSGPDE